MMIEFKSVFAIELYDYLSIRQMTLEKGTCNFDRYVLGDFVKYHTEHGLDGKVVTEELINGWIQHLRTKNHSRTVSNKVSCLRSFLRYLHHCGVPAFIPQCPKYHEDYVPYFFSDAEMEEVFLYSDRAAVGDDDKTDFEVAMLIRILYGCGLRHGEALHLTRGDVDFNRGTLFMRKAKNKKQRIVPMHPSLTKMLVQYCVAMNIYEKPDAPLFPGTNPDSPVSIKKTGNRFKKILKSANLYIPPEKINQRGQCLHCLRHVFAIKSFAQAERNGRLAADSVPYLSVYLGHFNMDGTEKYMKFSSDIFPEYTEMFEAYSASVFTVLGGAE